MKSTTMFYIGSFTQSSQLDHEAIFMNIFSLGVFQLSRDTMCRQFFHAMVYHQLLKI